MRQHNHKRAGQKRYGRKPSGKQQMLKLAVLAIGIADAAGIYYAHEKLNRPAPNSLQGELLALQQQSQAETPRVINPVPDERLAVAQPGISVDPELRFSPSPSVPDVEAKAPAPKQLAKAELPAPAFGNAARPAVAVAPMASQPVVIQTALAKPAMATRGNSLSSKKASPVLVAPNRAVPDFAVAPVVKSIPAPALTKAPAKVIHQAATTLHTRVHKEVVRQASIQPIQQSSVADQTAAFNTAFADLANTPEDTISVQDDQQHVASAPAAIDLPDSSAAPTASAELLAMVPSAS